MALPRRIFPMSKRLATISNPSRTDQVVSRRTKGNFSLTSNLAYLTIIMLTRLGPHGWRQGNMKNLATFNVEKPFPDPDLARAAL